MSVKVGNLVTDEKNVREVLSVEDGEQMMNALGAGDMAKNAVASSNNFGFGVFNDGKCFAVFEPDTSNSEIKGVYFDDTGIKGFRFSSNEINEFTPN